MTLKEYLRQVEESERLIRIDKPVSRLLETAGILKAVEPEPVLFSNIKECRFQVAGNLFTSKAAVAEFFRLRPKEIVPFLIEALNKPIPPETTSIAPCQQVVVSKPDLDELPILLHTEKDGGRYISAGVMIASHPQYGQNLDFHRCMQISKNQFAVRVVKNRHFDRFLNDLNCMEVAICVGLTPNILLAAATSTGIGVDELGIANAMQPFNVVKAKTVDLWVPADCEFVLEGIIYLDRTHAEGPFVDLTGTYDIVREQPVMEVKTITYRQDAVWHALLPGGLEHKLLMGMPREPTIFQEVNKVAECLDVNITAGGSSWLHAVVQINKHSDADVTAAIRAAFTGHRSCKHVFIVDPDIDIYDPNQVEWAMATRFQGDKDMLVLPPEQGSSLDPSADPESHYTTKIGFDLTKPLNAQKEHFSKAEFPKIDPGDLPKLKGKT